MGLKDRLQHAWNAFSNKDPTPEPKTVYYTSSSTYRPDRVRFSGGNEKSIVTAIYNRMAMDAASIDIKHVRLDKKGRYVEDINSGLNNCLTLEANLDQSAKAFKQDVYMSLFDEGCIAIVPVDTDIDPTNPGAYDILTMRTGRILEWRPDKVLVSVYNENKGRHKDVWVNKLNAAIIENPLYSVMNERNSTMQRLIRKLNLLDAIDEQSGSGKLDIIIQLPYLVRSDARRKQADTRRQDIENQLKNSKLGIAYTDGTEKIIQLNRPVENNLMKQVEYLTSMLYSQLGITQTVLDGTADDKTMTNYFNRTIDALVSTVVLEMRRTFLTKTARTQRQSIAYFRDPFKLIPVVELAELADKFTRNEIMTSNELRQTMGFIPSDDPKADQLINSNLSQATDQKFNPENIADASDKNPKEGEIQNDKM